MRTSALALTAPLRDKLRPFIKVAGDDQVSPYMGVLADGPFLSAIADPMPMPDLWGELEGWCGSIKDWILKMATHMTYGGAGITTNRLNSGGTAPVNGGWGLNTAGLTTSITDTALFDPAPEARVAGTFSQQTTAANVPNDTAQVVVTIQASAARAITEFGLFDSSAAAPQTTLNGSVSLSTQTVLPVTSTAGFSNNDYCQLDNEVIGPISGMSAGQITAARGARGSTAATHATGAAVVGGEGASNMFMKGDFPVINLSSGDSIQFTAKMQYLPQ
jgi:hypothetical protein